MSNDTTNEENKDNDWQGVLSQIAPHVGMILATIVHLAGTIDSDQWLNILVAYVAGTSFGAGLGLAGKKVGDGAREAGDRIYRASLEVNASRKNPDEPEVYLQTIDNQVFRKEADGSLHPIGTIENHDSGRTPGTG